MSFGSTFGIANPTPVPTLKAIKASEGKMRANVPVTQDTLVRIVTCRKDAKDRDSKKEVLPIAEVSSNFDPSSTEEDLNSMQERIARQKVAKNCR